MKNNIILIGYMGAGKSTVGKALAKCLGYHFLDTDLWIEKKEGEKISLIFEKKGEEYFRNKETECLIDLLSEEKGKVISVGGGLPLRSKNRELLKKLGRVVYLKATPEVIFERVKNDQSRPLLQTDNPKERIITMMKEREEFYQEAACLTILVDNKSVEQIISEIPVAL